MSTGSGDVEVEGGASELNSRFGEIVRVGEGPEGSFRRKGDDDGDAGVPASGGGNG